MWGFSVLGAGGGQDFGDSLLCGISGMKKDEFRTIEDEEMMETEVK